MTEACQKCGEHEQAGGVYNDDFMGHFCSPLTQQWAVVQLSKHVLV